MAPPIRATPYLVGSRRQFYRQADQQAAVLPLRGSRLSPHFATEEERKDYARVLELFDDYFKVRRNVIFERARLNRRAQLPGESTEEFIMDIYTLAATYYYGNLEKEMIRDRLVVGIRDNALSATLQTDTALTLETAKLKIRQGEAAHEQRRKL